MSLLQIAEPGESEVKEACAGRAIGIDLGTTNSLVATVRDGNPITLRDDKDRALLPSMVHYHKDGGVLVGHVAQTLAADFAKDTIGSAKRFVGRGPKDAEATRKLTPYEFADVDGPVVKFRVAGEREVTPVEVSAEILRVLRERAEEALGGPIDGAVITVPAYFDDAQRQATKDAGKLAGLNVLRLLNEPTAAALAYGLDKGSQGIYAIYDLGGGTFDVSILSLSEGVFEVKATAGDSALGGDDFDRAIAGQLLDEMGLPDGGGDHTLVRRALDAARAAKERLTADDATDVSVAKPDGTILRRRFTRTELDELILPIIKRTAKPCRQAMKDAGVVPSDIKGVVLVGGSTRTQAVRRVVAELFAAEPLADIDPDRVVAMGAAIQADILAGSGRRDDVLLLDVIPLSLGLEMMGGVVEKIIHRNSTIPAGAVQTFTTFADKQTGFDLHVVQGERDSVEDCRSLARFKLGGLPPRPAGMARMDITFLVDPDGILRVMAKDEETGKQASIHVKPSYGLTDEEVERMLLESYENAEADKNKRQLLTERVEADRIAAATKSAMADAPDLLDAATRAEIEGALDKLAQARSADDTDAIHAAVEVLDLAAKPFAQKRMEQAMSQGMRGQRIEEVEQKL